MIITEILQSYLKHGVMCIIHDMYVFYFYGSPPVWAYHMTLHEMCLCVCVCVCMCVVHCIITEAIVTMATVYYMTKCECVCALFAVYM